MGSWPTGRDPYEEAYRRMEVEAALFTLARDAAPSMPTSTQDEAVTPGHGDGSQQPQRTPRTPAARPTCWGRSNSRPSSTKPDRLPVPDKSATAVDRLLLCAQAVEALTPLDSAPPCQLPLMQAHHLTEVSLKDRPQSFREASANLMASALQGVNFGFQSLGSDRAIRPNKARQVQGEHCLPEDAGVGDCKHRAGKACAHSASPGREKVRLRRSSGSPKRSGELDPLDNYSRVGDASSLASCDGASRVQDGTVADTAGVLCEKLRSGASPPMKLRVPHLPLPLHTTPSGHTPQGSARPLSKRQRSSPAGPSPRLHTYQTRPGRDSALYMGGTRAELLLPAAFLDAFEASAHPSPRTAQDAKALNLGLPGHGSAVMLGGPCGGASPTVSLTGVPAAGGGAMPAVALQQEGTDGATLMGGGLGNGGAASAAAVGPYNAAYAYEMGRGTTQGGVASGVEQWSEAWDMLDSPRPRDKQSCMPGPSRGGLHVAVPLGPPSLPFSVPPETLARLGVELATDSSQQVWSSQGWLGILACTHPVDRRDACALRDWLAHNLEPYMQKNRSWHCKNPSETLPDPPGPYNTEAASCSKFKGHLQAPCIARDVTSFPVGPVESSPPTGTTLADEPRGAVAGQTCASRPSGCSTFRVESQIISPVKEEAYDLSQVKGRYDTGARGACLLNALGSDHDPESREGPSHKWAGRGVGDGLGNGAATPSNRNPQVEDERPCEGQTDLHLQGAPKGHAPEEGQGYQRPGQATVTQTPGEKDLSGEAMPMACCQALPSGIPAGSVEGKVGAAQGCGGSSPGCRTMDEGSRISVRGPLSPRVGGDTVYGRGGGWIGRIARDEEESTAVLQLLATCAAAATQQVAVHCHERGALLAAVWNMTSALQHERLSRAVRERETAARDAFEARAAACAAASHYSGSGGQELQSLREENCVLRARVSLLEGICREAEREAAGKVQDMQRDLDNVSAVRDRVAKTLAKRLLAKDNAFKALKADRNVLAALLHETAPVAQEAITGLQELSSRLLAALNLPPDTHPERLAAARHPVAPVLAHLRKLTSVLQVLDSRAAHTEDEHALLEARANVLETLAEDEGAGPDALMASELLARARGAASIPAALLAKWRLDGGLDALLDLLSTHAHNPPPPLPLSTFIPPPPVAAGPPVLLSVKVEERVYVRIKVLPMPPVVKVPVGEAADVAALQARLATLEAELAAERQQAARLQEAADVMKAEPLENQGMLSRTVSSVTSLGYGNLLAPGDQQRQPATPRRKPGRFSGPEPPHRRLSVAVPTEREPEGPRTSRARGSILAASGTISEGGLFSSGRATAWAGVRDVRLVDALAKYGDMKPRGLPWLLKLMDAVYYSKGARGEDKERSSGAKPSFPEILLSHLSASYGAKTIVSEYAACVMITVAHYEKQDERVVVFAKFLREEWDGSFLTAFLQATEILAERATVPCVDYPPDYVPRLGASCWVCVAKCIAVAEWVLGQRSRACAHAFGSLLATKAVPAEEGELQRFLTTPAGLSDRDTASAALAEHVLKGRHLKLAGATFLYALCAEAARCETVFVEALPRLMREADEDGNGVMSQVEVTAMLCRMTRTPCVQEAQQFWQDAVAAETEERRAQQAAMAHDGWSKGDTAAPLSPSLVTSVGMRAAIVAAEKCPIMRWYVRLFATPPPAQELGVQEAEGLKRMIALLVSRQWRRNEAALAALYPQAGPKEAGLLEQASKMEAEADGPTRLQILMSILQTLFEARLASLAARCTPASLSRGFDPDLEHSFASAFTALKVLYGESCLLREDFATGAGGGGQASVPPTPLTPAGLQGGEGVSSGASAGAGRSRGLLLKLYNDLQSQAEQYATSVIARNCKAALHRWKLRAAARLAAQGDENWTPAKALAPVVEGIED